MTTPFRDYIRVYYSGYEGKPYTHKGSGAAHSNNGRLPRAAQQHSFLTTKPQAVTPTPLTADYWLPQTMEPPKADHDKYTEI